MGRGSRQYIRLYSGGASMLGHEGSMQKYGFGKQNSRRGAGLDFCLSDPCLLSFPSQKGFV